MTSRADAAARRLGERNRRAWKNDGSNPGDGGPGTWTNSPRLDEAVEAFCEHHDLNREDSAMLLGRVRAQFGHLRTDQEKARAFETESADAARTIAAERGDALGVLPARREDAAARESVARATEAWRR